MNKSGWYFILLAILIFADVIMNELGFGAITFLPLTLLACWLMGKAFEKEKPIDQLILIFVGIVVVWSMINKIRYWFYHFIYSPLISLWDDYRYRNDPPLPPVPCQICGETGHREKYCPSAREYGF